MIVKVYKPDPYSSNSWPPGRTEYKLSAVYESQNVSVEYDKDTVTVYYPSQTVQINGSISCENNEIRVKRALGAIEAITGGKR